ncbi:MAG: O-antigen ligase family protein [Schleiferiaceae bacterium]|jgi:hypothetical protein|nr:O-antigen ligase family protein [Schleiferiaceae bacterium]
MDRTLKSTVLSIGGLLLITGLLGYLVSQFEFAAIGSILSIPVLIAYLYLSYKYEKLGLYLVLILSFVLPIFGRYIPSSLPYGLSVDIILIISILLLFIKHSPNVKTERLKHPIFLLMLIWMLYILFQMLNPLAHSLAAWFYSMRGIALYQTLIFIILFLTFDSKKDLKPFFMIWLGFSILGLFWGIKQQMLGVSAAEQRWLDEGGAITHVLFGKLRVFSYYYDAGTFGAAMGQISLICGILATDKNLVIARRILLLILCLLFFYGLMISGTRGALAVPGAGAIAYLIYTKNIRILVPGIIVLALAFSFLKFTNIGQSNYEINRLRTALDPNDASLQVRIRNRARLTEYLKDKPFGGGIGTTGNWGNRFSPGTWLAEFEPDGLYTRIRAEGGIVGRNLYVGIWLYIFIWSIRLVWKKQYSKDKLIAIAFLSGYAGILLANYGNSVLTQFPISITTFMSLFFAFSILQTDDQAEATEEVN